MSDGWKQTGLPCPDAVECGSSDAYAVNTEGWGTCFSCNKRFKEGVAQEEKSKKSASKKAGLITDLTVIDLVARNISKTTCEKFGYGTSMYSGKPVQVAPYHDAKGQVVAQKLRFPGKDFTVLGSLKEATLFGQNLWRDGGKRLVITEGEIDALSYAQATGCSWPVVSVPNGAAGAKKAIEKQLEWIERFDEVVLLFDNDEPGLEAAAEVAEVLSPGKCKIAALPLKDANEMLKAGRVKELMVAVWEAKVRRADGIRCVADVMEDALKPTAMGLSWPWPILTRATHGIRMKEVYALGAGTGVGKTDVFTEIVAHLIETHKEKVGLLFLEQNPAETVKRVAGKLMSKRFHVPDAGWTTEELELAVKKLADDDSVYLYDHFGSIDFESVKSKIRYMVRALGIKHIFLDHLTALAAQAEDERKELESIMAELGAMTQELNFALYFVSHLATPEGKSHEEGGRVTIRHFKGSRAIGYWSHFMFGLERNQQCEDESERHITTFRVLKDRYTGQATGMTFRLQYNSESGRLSVVNEDFEDAGAAKAGEGEF